MASNVDEKVPTVVIYNNLETFYQFLNRTDDTSVMENRLYRGDRALLWAGDPKLVFATSDVQHLDYLKELGYKDTVCLAPENPSPWLSLDVLREEPLLKRLVEYAGTDRTIRMIPYATTMQFLQLAEVLRTDYNLTVHLPESPDPEHLWVRDYMDTKAGFRVMAQQWLRKTDACLPEGLICENITQAAQAAIWFQNSGRECIIKADKGEGSLGHFMLTKAKAYTLEALTAELHDIPLLRNDLLVVEEYIHSERNLSPSLEFRVPPKGQGEPHLTYPANQLFLESGAFDGVLISRELIAENWYAALLNSGLRLAQKLQESGYIGHFDLDAVVDDQDCVYLLETNMRRTGGTHTHDLAVSLFGEDYLNDVTLISHNKIQSGKIQDFETLLRVLDGLMYPINGDKAGIVITVTSAMARRQFGCTIIGEHADHAFELQKRLRERLDEYCKDAPQEMWAITPNK